LITPQGVPAISLLLAYYGDDFTGSTDAMEQLVRGGVPTVLFVEPPTPKALASYPHVRAVGVAGQSRTMSPEQMNAELPAAFASLAAHRPQFVHYKVCSTFDSSPSVGSIGRAIDIGARMFQNRVTPLVVGAPSLGRYCLFGNLFARSGLDSPPFRLDRHPTMRRHPVTPMDESDLRVHLSRQTDRLVTLIDGLALDQGVAEVTERVSQAADGDIILFDALTDAHLATIGAVLIELQRQENKPLFVAGSSGIESALTQAWKDRGMLKDAGEVVQPASPVEPIVAVSGSCSPVTDRQIGWALEHGFLEASLDVAALSSSRDLESELSAIANRIVKEHDAGRSVIVHTSRGAPDDRLAVRLAGNSAAATPGQMLGRVLDLVLQSRIVFRFAVAGGDTAGDVARTLGIEALQMVAPLAPGAPLCQARSRRPYVDGVEFTFKGGQVGREDFFGVVQSPSN
jgi:3-oxoisoapionate kinase